MSSDDSSSNSEDTALDIPNLFYKNQTDCELHKKALERIRMSLEDLYLTRPQSYYYHMSLSMQRHENALVDLKAQSMRYQQFHVDALVDDQPLESAKIYYLNVANLEKLQKIIRKKRRNRDTFK